MGTSLNIIDRVSNGISQAAYLMSPGNYDRGNNSPQGNQSLKSPIPSSAPRRVTASDIASPNDVDNWSIDESCHTKTPSDHPLYREWNHHTTGVDAPSSNSPPMMLLLVVTIGKVWHNNTKHVQHKVENCTFLGSRKRHNLSLGYRRVS